MAVDVQLITVPATSHWSAFCDRCCTSFTAETEELTRLGASYHAGRCTKPEFSERSDEEKALILEMKDDRQDA